MPLNSEFPIFDENLYLEDYKTLDEILFENNSNSNEIYIPYSLEKSLITQNVDITTGSNLELYFNKKFLELEKKQSEIIEIQKDINENLVFNNTLTLFNSFVFIAITIILLIARRR